jgi:hypothetical protein
MPRPQFTLRALLVAMLVVGAFFGGMAVQRTLDQRKRNTALTFQKDFTTPGNPSKTYSTKRRVR